MKPIANFFAACFVLFLVGCGGPSDDTDRQADAKDRTPAKSISGIWRTETGDDNRLMSATTEVEFQSNGSVTYQSEIKAGNERSTMYAEGTYGVHDRAIVAKLKRKTVTGSLASKDDGNLKDEKGFTVQFSLEPNGDMIEDGDSNHPGTRFLPAKAN